MMRSCTWSPRCPSEGVHRLEHTGFTGGGVEFVCDAHLEVAKAHGYRPPREL